MQQKSLTELPTNHAPIDRRNDALGAMEHSFEGYFRCWNLSSLAKFAEFQAKLRGEEFGVASKVHIVVDPGVGQLSLAHLQWGDELYINLQLNLSGRVRIRQLGTQICAREMFVWRSDRRQDYEVLERARSVSLMIPWQLLREYLPGRRQPPSACRINTRAGVGSLLSRHLIALSEEIDAVPPSAHLTLCRTVIGLLDIALPEPQCATKLTTKTALRERVLYYIAQHLHEDNLSPARIAAAQGISVRYLHALFSQCDTTVVGHILESRLHACRQTLADQAFKHLQISEIAFRWGFNSTSHFCRTFKQLFGMPPSEVRRRAAPCTPYLSGRLIRLFPHAQEAHSQCIGEQAAQRHANEVPWMASERRDSTLRQHSQCFAPK
ncbi:helix-turn-helix domain-containing protein [Pseudomonas aeruginosa]|nr:helix-turn-helix domain-containing protein [Pseudomonas aeruginosa]MCS9139101.1 helix-turn-helix domain-containing protein [Pseudomonas aeruginosa]MCS9211918.1 helix-turn-helix domain-containing protein [Pseudomonas aeruginosa]